MSFVSHLTRQTRDDWPSPQIGYYYAVCCLLDLYRIEDQDDIDYIEELIDDMGPYAVMIFPTLAEAIEYLAPGHSEEEQREVFQRLGWEG